MPSSHCICHCIAIHFMTSVFVTGTKTRFSWPHKHYLCYLILLQRVGHVNKWWQLQLIWMSEYLYQNMQIIGLDIIVVMVYTLYLMPQRVFRRDLHVELIPSIHCIFIFHKHLANLNYFEVAHQSENFYFLWLLCTTIHLQSTAKVVTDWNMNKWTDLLLTIKT